MGMRRLSAALLVAVACGARTDLGSPSAIDASVDVAVPVDASVDVVSPVDAAHDVVEDVQPLTECNGSILVNCSFESPLVAVGGFETVDLGDDIPKWVVVGVDEPPNGSVDIVSTTFVEDGFSFVAEDGNQSINLASSGINGMGIEQTAFTTAGVTYRLSFWIGNVVDPNGTHGVTSTIDVNIAYGQLVATQPYDYIESNVLDGGSTLAWQEFTITFVAGEAKTPISFYSQDPNSDTCNYLDNVTLSPLP
jgi:hypothetical protein